MIDGILQRLTITEQTQSRLVLRELPLLEILVVGSLMLLAFNFAIFELLVTAIIAILLGVFFAFQAKMRRITFDADANMLIVTLQSLRRDDVVLQYELHKISRAYLSKDERGYSQIILVSVTGDEMGLSVYSRDLVAWKEPIVIAINAILHEAHKDDDELGDATV